MRARALLAALALAALGAQAQATTAIVVHDGAPMSASPRDAGKPHTLLWQGEAVEVRGTSGDHVQVYDHRRERGGFVPASALRRHALTPDEAPALLAVLRFLRETPGAEALGLGYAAAFVQAAPASVLRSPDGIEAIEAMGLFADRLARRASASATASKEAQAKLSAQLDVAARYGVRIVSRQSGERLRLCYDGEAFRRVLSLEASAPQRARAVLALTRPECDPEGAQEGVEQLVRALEWTRSVDTAELEEPLRDRLLMRRARIASAAAFHAARHKEAHLGASLAETARNDLAKVRRASLVEHDQRAYDEAALHVAATRWAAAPAPREAAAGAKPMLVARPGEDGQTCLLLVDARNDESRPLARRCTWGHAWLAATRANAEGTAVAAAVQQTDTWRELWIFRKSGGKWEVRVLPPAAALGTGTAEFAGFVPGGEQVLVARASAEERGVRRSYEVVRLSDLATVKSAPAPTAAFRRWQDPAWRRDSLLAR